MQKLRNHRRIGGGAGISVVFKERNLPYRRCKVSAAGCYTKI